MALELSQTARLLTQENNIEANVILEIDGFTEIFGAEDVTEIAKIGSFVIGDGTKIGGVVADPNSRDWISLQGTTNNISQKVDLDKTGATSVSTFNVNLIDVGDQLTEMFSPGIRVPDMLGRNAKVSWAAQGSAHPEDSVVIFRGIISDLAFGAGNVTLRIDSPEQLKRQDILPKVTTELTSGIDNSVTTIPVDDASAFVTSQDILTTYVRIDDEVIEVGDVSGNNLINCIRGQLNTLAASHDLGNDVESFYRLQGAPITMALKIMLSGVGYYGGETASTVRQMPDLTTVENGFYFDNSTLAEDTGITEGDLITTTGATNGANNVTDRTIVDVRALSSGTVIVVDGAALVDETSTSIAATFKSQYDTLNFGCSISPFHVDVNRFQELFDLFGTSFPAMDLYIKDQVNAQELIDTELLFPAGMFSIFRKGRISIGASVPPLATEGVVTLDNTNIKRPEQIKINRSINKYFYNSIVYKYEQDSIEDKFLASRITLNEDSSNRIPIGNRSLTIESLGLRNNALTNNLLDNVATRMLDRYKFGAEKITAELLFKDGFAIEIGDSVILEGSTIKLSDITQGSRDFNTRIMEVTNKSFNLKTGDVKLECIDSNYDAKARYGVISPASKVGSGSTTTEIVLEKSYGTGDFESEQEKWLDYIGQRVTIRSPDFTTVETTQFNGFKGGSSATMLVNAISGAPSADWIVESPAYDETNSKTDRYYKAIHAYTSPEVEITSGASSTQFDVGAGDVGKFAVGVLVTVHNATYTNNIEVEVTDITGTTITTEDMGFTPTSAYECTVAHFGDNGFGYKVF